MRRALSRLKSARFASAVELEAALDRVRAEINVDLRRARVRCGFGRGHLLEAVVYVPGGVGSRDETEAAARLVRFLIGEELFERWLGAVSATPTVRGGPLPVVNAAREDRDALALGDLKAAVEAAIAGLKLGLPAQPLAAFAAGADWLMFELEPERRVDYAAQDDLLLCSTRTPELKKCFLRDEPFFSGRFSKVGELFVYLKYESQESAPEARLREREVLEEIAARALAPSGGALIGTGLGLRYSYLDFAIGDPDCMSHRVLPALSAANITGRAWLLFFDSELEREWRPLYDDSPTPCFTER